MFYAQNCLLQDLEQQLSDLNRLRPELKRPEPTSVSELANKNENLRKVVRNSLVVAFVIQ